VAGHEDQTVFLDVLKSHTEAVVVAAVGVFDGFPDRWFEAGFGSELSLFSHVSSSDELEPKVVAKLLRALNLVLDNLTHSLEIALISIHDNVLVAFIINVSHLLPKWLNGSLHEGLLSVNIKHTVSFASNGSDAVNSFWERTKYLQVVLSKANTAANSNSFVEFRVEIGIKFEEVSIGVDFKTADSIGLVVFKLEWFEQLVYFLLREVDTSLEERVFEFAHVDWLLLVELEDIVHVDFLGATHTGHHIGRYQTCKLKSKVALLFSLGLGMDGLHHVLKHSLHKFVVHNVKSLDDVVGNSVDIVLLQGPDVLNKRWDGFSWCEQGADCLVYEEVG
jgi:hypothetical protein